MRLSSPIAMFFSALALMTAACGADVEPEPTASVSDRITACGYQPIATAVCDRTAVLGTCTEFRSQGMDMAEAEAVCASTDGVFKTASACPRSSELLGVCPAQEAPGKLRLHHYYMGEVFADDTVPCLACSALTPGSWCSGQGPEGE